MNNNTNPIPLSHFHTSPEAKIHLRKRKRGTRRLRIAGMVSIGFAAFALAFLLFSVLAKSFGNFTQHTFSFDIPLTAEVIDPDQTGDSNIIRRANYSALIQKALIAEYPYMDTRQERRALSALVSGEAQFDLGNLVYKNKELIGQTVPFELLASDTADLYYKGYYGTLDTLLTSNGKMLKMRSDAFSQKGSAVTLESDTETFNNALDMFKKLQQEEARRIYQRARLQQQGADYIERQLARVGDDSLSVLERKNAQKQLSIYTTRYNDLTQQAQTLERLATATGGVGQLDDTTFSLFVHVRNGVIKVTQIMPSQAKGEIIVPLLQTEGSFETDVWSLKLLDQPESVRKLSDTQVMVLEDMKKQGVAQSSWNTRYFTGSDSREPELAGIWGAAVGSFFTMLVTMFLSVPVGILSSIYLEEFAPKNRITDLIEITINNLAAVPSIIFGLLGLAVFLNFFGVPRSTPLAGGIVLALMTLPTIIIASRAAIRAVPPSIRDAALGLGASKVQASFHHVLPLALPGILTGTIIGMAQALGETAPLIMIGMVAFLVEAPAGITDSATALPVQIYRWSAFPEPAFEMRTAATILVLLGFLVCMNGLAIWLRKRFERRW